LTIFVRFRSKERAFIGYVTILQQQTYSNLRPFNRQKKKQSEGVRFC